MSDVFVRVFDGGQPPPGWKILTVPGCETAFVDGELAARVEDLLGKGQIVTAKSLMLWFGAPEKK